MQKNNDYYGDAASVGGGALLMRRIRQKCGLVGYALRLLFRRSPALSLLFLALIAAQGVFPGLSVLLGIRLGDIVGAADRSGLLAVGLCWALTLVIPGVLSPMISTLQSILNQQATWLTQKTIMEAACRIDDLKVIEQPDIHNTLEVLSREAAFRPLNLLVNLVDIIRGALTLSSLSLVLASVAWWLPLAFLLPLIPVSWTAAQSQMDIFRAMLGKGAAARLIRYYLMVLLDVKLAKEIRVFDAASFFMDKHAQAFNRLESELNQVRRKQLLRPQPWNLLYLLASLGVMYWFADYLQTGRITVGGLLGTIQSLAYFGLTSQWMVYAIANLGVCFSFFARLRELENVAESRPVLEAHDPGPIREITFDNVSFSYREGEPVLRNINLTLRAGDRLAIVGENGAGKSTLVKLLCRLYQPDAGRITCNGVDIATMDIRLWRRCLSAVFQDFGQYHLTVQENVTFRDTLDAAQARRFFDACERARFPLTGDHAADSFLGREYCGAELSGGQWQRLALARALFAQGQLIILDEPTSALDPRVEAALFARFAELMRGKTAVMVTHRLGAVNSASRVIVMKKGAIVESGTPDELEKSRGEYAALLHLQRSQYQPAAQEQGAP